MTVSEVEKTNAQKVYEEMQATAENGIWVGYVKDLKSTPYPSQVLTKLSQKGAVQRLVTGSYQNPSEYRLIHYPDNQFMNASRKQIEKSYSSQAGDLNKRIAVLEANFSIMVDQLNGLNNKISKFLDAINSEQDAPDYYEEDGESPDLNDLVIDKE